MPDVRSNFHPNLCKFRYSNCRHASTHAFWRPFCSGHFGYGQNKKTFWASRHAGRQGSRVRPIKSHVRPNFRMCKLIFDQVAPVRLGRMRGEYFYSNQPPSLPSSALTVWLAYNTSHLYSFCLALRPPARGSAMSQYLPPARGSRCATSERIRHNTHIGIPTMWPIVNITIVTNLQIYQREPHSCYGNLIATDERFPQGSHGTWKPWNLFIIFPGLEKTWKFSKNEHIPGKC